MTTKIVDVCGDILRVRWDVSGVWISPSVHVPFSSARAAMRAELEHYFSSIGEAELDEIEGYLDQMTAEAEPVETE